MASALNLSLDINVVRILESNKQSMFKYCRPLVSRNSLRGKLRKSSQSGFTIFEVVTVLLFFSVLVSIAIPSWNKFIHFQRITKVEDRIMQAISQTRNKAQRENRSISLRFKTRDGVSLVSQHYSNDEANWKPLLDGSGIKPGQIEVFGQLGNLTLTFNYKGEVTTQVPYTMKVAAPGRNADPSYRGCAVVWTLFGTSQRGLKADDCPTREGATPATGEIIYRKN